MLPAVKTKILLLVILRFSDFELAAAGPALGRTGWRGLRRAKKTK